MVIGRPEEEKKSQKDSSELFLYLENLLSAFSSQLFLLEEKKRPWDM